MVIEIDSTGQVRNAEYSLIALMCYPLTCLEESSQPSPAPTALDSTELQFIRQVATLLDWYWLLLLALHLQLSR